MTFDLQAARADVAAYDSHKTNAFLHARTGTFLHLALNEIGRQAKRIAELESNLIAQKSYVDYWESESDRQRVALRKLSKQSGQRGKTLAEVLESLEHIECQFFACPGPDEPFEDMATCHRYAAIQMIRSQLRLEGLL